MIAPMPAAMPATITSQMPRLPLPMLMSRHSAWFF
jgi:hypothetical protein